MFYTSAYNLFLKKTTLKLFYSFPTYLDIYYEEIIIYIYRERERVDIVYDYHYYQMTLQVSII
jgi:hypothetical protein